jgi:hypothetical protein
MATYMPYLSNEVPVIKTFSVDGVEYRYQIDYNTTADFYTLTVKDEIDTILYTTKLVMGNDGLHSAHTIIDVQSGIIPRNFDKVIEYLNNETFDEVKLYVESV